MRRREYTEGVVCVFLEYLLKIENKYLDERMYIIVCKGTFSFWVSENKDSVNFL